MPQEQREARAPAQALKEHPGLSGRRGGIAHDRTAKVSRENSQ
jgi:hypothetical protein